MIIKDSLLRARGLGGYGESVAVRILPDSFGLDEAILAILGLLVVPAIGVAYAFRKRGPVSALAAGAGTAAVVYGVLSIGKDSK